MDFLVVVGAVLSVGFWAGLVVYSRGPLRTLQLTVARLERTVDRIEQAAQIVASDLAATGDSLTLAANQRAAQSEALKRIEVADHLVADNLASSVSRADATNGPDGAAADAALRTGDTPAEIHKRQDARARLSRRSGD